MLEALVYECLRHVHPQEGILDIDRMGLEICLEIHKGAVASLRSAAFGRVLGILCVGGDGGLDKFECFARNELLGEEHPPVECPRPVDARAAVSVSAGRGYSFKELLDCFCDLCFVGRLFGSAFLVKTLDFQNE